MKHDFLATALSKEVNFDASLPLDVELIQALDWMADRTPSEIMQEREQIMQDLEARASQLVSDGCAGDWLSESDPYIKVISKDVNGPMLEHMASQTEFHDGQCVQTLRDGARLLGDLPISGNGVVIERTVRSSIDELRGQALERNRSLLQALTPDTYAYELLELTKEDARKHRMSPPMDVAIAGSRWDLSECVIAPRFGVARGCKDDGSPKIRAVDDETKSGVNPCCGIGEKMRLDSIDTLVSLLLRFRSMMNTLPSFWKADIDSAFRRVPLHPDDRWAAHVAFAVGGRTYVAGHLSMPFGATASVHAWDRIGALLCFLARKLLKLPVLRYVDDFFSVDFPECAQHAMNCFARMVRILLGKDAVAQGKLMCGMPLTILGLRLAVDQQGVSCWPSPDKVVKWCSTISAALSSNSLRPGEASKLAGALSWAGQHVFNRLGRAMLLPLYRQKNRRASNMTTALRLSLEWWLEVLQLEMLQRRPWVRPTSSTVHLFADARGTPPRLAAVVFVDGQIFYSDLEPAASVLQFFVSRRDSQIMGLELLAIALGLSTFEELLAGRRICIWSDNVGSERGVHKGVAKAWDHAQIIHCIWTHAVHLRAHLHVERVPTEENIADLPSRCEYKLLEDMNAVWCAPRLADKYCDRESWRALSLRNVLG